MDLGGRRLAARREQRTVEPRRIDQGLVMRDPPDTVVGRHQQERKGGIPSSSSLRHAAEDQTGGKHDQQIDVDDRHPIDREPVPVERTESTDAVGRREVHQQVEHNADDRDRCQQAKRRPRLCGRGSFFQDTQSDPDDPRREQPESNDAERPVRWPAMPRQVAARAARGRQDIDVRGIRGEDQGGGRAASCPAERRACQGQCEQGVGEVVHNRRFEAGG